MKTVKKVQLFISSLSMGGAERVMSCIATELVKRDVEVQLVLVSSDRIEYDVDNRVEIVRLCEKVRKNNGTLRGLLRLALVRQAVKGYNADVVVAFMCERYVCFSCIGLGKKIIVSERNDPHTRPTGKLQRIIRRLSFALATGRVFQTKDAQHFYGGSVEKNSVIILNPLKEGLPERFEGERRRTVAAVGRLTKQKNYPLLLEAFSLLPQRHCDVTLEIYGDGEERQDLEKLSSQLGISDRVTFFGNRTDVHERIKDVSAYVMTSDYEGLPNALMEAMALGLACISTDCPCKGPASLISDGENGMLFEVGDKNALVQKLTTLLDDAALCEKLGANAVTINKMCNKEKIVDCWLEYMQRICEK